MDRNRALLQLRLVRGVVVGERKRGRLTPELRQRALEIVDETAVAVEPMESREWAALVDDVRSLIAGNPD